jgi:hypothetical protein
LRSVFDILDVLGRFNSGERRLYAEARSCQIFYDDGCSLQADMAYFGRLQEHAALLAPKVRDAATIANEMEKLSMACSVVLARAEQTVQVDVRKEYCKLRLMCAQYGFLLDAPQAHLKGPSTKGHGVRFSKEVLCGEYRKVESHGEEAVQEYLSVEAFDNTFPTRLSGGSPSCSRMPRMRDNDGTAGLCM